VYRTSDVPANTPPSAPSRLALSYERPQPSIGAGGFTFSWIAATDAETPAAGLTYNLRVGTTPGGCEVLSPMSAANGFRKVAQMGNVGHRLRWTLAMPRANYYWSVQAVDGAFAGSPFATEHSWTVDVPTPAPIAPGFALHANRPNPFSGMTRIAFELPHEARVRLEVHDLGGRRVRALIDGSLLPAGPHEVEWDGRGPRGERARDGVYFCVMEADAFRSTQRMVLAR
jgi:hypothetical protein